MDRIAVLNYINEIIEDEHGVAVSEEQLLIDCEIDSFGYAILWTSLEEKFSIKFEKDESFKLDYSVLTVSDVIDLVEKKVNEAK